MRFMCVAQVSAAVVLTTASDAHAQRPVQPLVQMSASASAMRDSIVALARAQLGRRYVRGGESPDRGFDCSGLVKYVLARMHMDVPRTAHQQARVGLPVAKDTTDLLPGDLVTFGRGKQGVSHIGIYVGRGDFIHASNVAGRVIERPLIRPPSPRLKPWVGARRLLALADTSRLRPATP